VLAKVARLVAGHPVVVTEVVLHDLSQSLHVRQLAQGRDSMDQTVLAERDHVNRVWHYHLLHVPRRKTVQIAEYLQHHQGKDSNPHPPGQEAKAEHGLAQDVGHLRHGRQ